MYGRTKKRIESVMIVKSNKSPETSMGSTLLSYDDNNSVVRRPTNHINGICYCYENKEDCTTCTEEESLESDMEVFVLSSDDSDTSVRLLGGSTPTSASESSSSSSDGSSLFDEQFSRKIEENLEFNKKIGEQETGIDGILSVLSEDGPISDEVVSAILSAHTGTPYRPEIHSETARKSPKISEKLQKLLEKRPYDPLEPVNKSSRAWLEYMILKLSRQLPECISGIETEIQRQSNWNSGILEILGNMKAQSRHQIQKTPNYISEKRLAIENYHSESLGKVNKLDVETLDFDASQVLIKKCKEEHAVVRREYLDRLFDEDIMKSNLLRIDELRAKIEEHRRMCRLENVDTQMEFQHILDQVSTCQSFSHSDL